MTDKTYETLFKILCTVMIASIILVGLFQIVKVANESHESSHVEKMEYAMNNIEYWEVTDDGLNLYDYDGNIYQWR